jgi:hypothetical protein
VFVFDLRPGGGAEGAGRGGGRERHGASEVDTGGGEEAGRWLKEIRNQQIIKVFKRKVE